MSDALHMLDGLGCGDRIQLTLGNGGTFAGEIVGAPNPTGTVVVDDGAVVTDIETPSTLTGTVTLSFECDPSDVSMVERLMEISQSFPEDGETNTPHLYGNGVAGGMSYRMQMGDITEIEVVDDE